MALQHHVQACELPAQALLRRHLTPGAHLDCFSVDMDQAVSQAEFVQAFYTTPVFKVERRLLGWLARMPSTDAQAQALAGGTLDAFAAWQLEARTPDQLLTADVIGGRTRSWLMSAPLAAPAGHAGTRLYFGTAVVPVIHRRSGQPMLGLAYTSLMGVHTLYSRILLSAARARLARDA